MGEHEDQEVSTSQEEEKDSDETDCVVKEEDLENQLGDLEDVDAWIVKTLHEIQPDAEITLGSVKVKEFKLLVSPFFDLLSLASNLLLSLLSYCRFCPHF